MSENSVTVANPVKRRTTDWEAIERDYRTGRFSTQELGDKYGVSRQAVDKQVKKYGWVRDLNEHIRAATNARLTQELVAQRVAESSEKVADAVAIAAEVNTQLIRGHKKKLADLQELLVQARQKVIEVSTKVADVREANTYVQAVTGLASATKTLIEQERKAFRLDEDDSGDDSTEAILRHLGAAIDGFKGT